MSTITELCQNIQIPEELTIYIKECENTLDYLGLEPSIKLLYNRETWEEGLRRLNLALESDVKGIKILTVMLHCAVLVFDDYKKKGIDETIYIATMKCFTRFIREYKECYGAYGFDRAFWTPRQIALKLFRIGELEYELILKNGKREVSLHIPSDAELSLTKLRDSFIKAKEFLEIYYSEYSQAKIVCNSWLLSPSLKELLPKTSKILDFQRSFIITSCEPEEKDYLEWVYKLCGEKGANARLSELPEGTTLQKNMKQYLLNGGKVGTAIGVLMEEPFLI